MKLAEWLYAFFMFFFESFGAFRFEDSKQLEQSIEDADSIVQLNLLKGDSREYAGFASGAFMSAIWVFFLSLGFAVAYFNIWTSLLVVASVVLFVYFFNHWRNANGLHSECMAKISLLQD